MRNTAQKKEQFLTVYAKRLCNVTETCRAIGIERKTFYRWYNGDARFKKAVDDTSEVRIDFVENALNLKIQSGDTAAIIFFLKTKGKHRGYVERVENTVSVQVEQPLFGDYDESKEC